MATPIEEILRVGFEVDTRGAIRSMEKFRRQLAQQVQRAVKAANQIGKANAKMTKEAASGVSEWQDQYEELADAQEAHAKAALDAARKVGKAEEKAAKQLADQTRLLKQQAAERKKSARAAGGRGQGLDVKTAKKAGKEVGGRIDEAFQIGGKKQARQLRKEMGRMGKEAIKAKLSGGGKGGGGKGGGGGMLGGKMPDLSGLKSIGGLMKTLGPLVGTLAKIGPVLGTIGSAVIGLIKVMIDAEAQAKEFQKAILDAAGNAEFLAKNAYDVDAAFYDLSETVRGVRNAAYDFNALFKEGLDTDDFKGVMNALNQEGVTLKRLGDIAYARRQGDEEHRESVKRTTIEITKMGVAYSKALGVPLAEISQLQAEMMTEMGTSLDETRLAFAQMTRAATESGIASNKFFAMIRGVSQDLSLYNTRIGSAAKLLAKLGKAMSPRNAQKFLQTATQGLKTMDQDARLRLNLLTGNKGQGIVEKDLNRKTTLLAKDIQKAFEDGGKGMAWGNEAAIAEVLKKGGIERAKLLRDLEESDQGALVDAAEEIDMDRAANKKGQYGTATAMGNLSAGAALDMKKAGLMSLSGGVGRSIKDAIGELGFEKTAQMLGISEDEVRGMAKLESSLERQRELLKADLNSGDEARKAAAKAAMKQAGLTEENLDKASFSDLMETLSQEERKQLEDDAATADQLMVKQKDLTETMLDKIEKLMGFIMNQIYEVMLSLYEFIIGWKGDRAAKDKVARIRAAKDAGVAGGEIGGLVQEKDFTGALAGSATNKALIEALDGVSQQEKRLAKLDEKRAAGTLKGKEKEEYDTLLSEESKAGRQAVKDVQNTLLESLSPEQLVETLKDVRGLSGKEAQLEKLKAEGKTDEAAVLEDQIKTMKDQFAEMERDIQKTGGAVSTKAVLEMSKKEKFGGFTDEERRAAAKKAAWHGGSGADAVKRFAALEKSMQSLGYTKEKGGKVVRADPVSGESAQTKASTKAGGPSAPPAPAKGGGKSATAPATAPAPTPQEVRPGASAGEAALSGGSEETPATAKGQGTMHEDMEELEKRLGQKGIRYEKGFMRSDYGKVIYDNVLDALRVALLEYSLYKDTGADDLAKMVKGRDPKVFGKEIFDEAKRHGKLVPGLEGAGKKGAGKKEGHASGGYIVGMNPDGTARAIRPPAGEIPIYAAPGEAILNEKQQKALAGGQRGGGGDLHLHVQVNGVGGRDLANYVEKAANNAVYEYKRREGLT